MAKPPKIQVPGLNRGAGIPPGYLTGRLPGSGHGPVQLIDVQQLIRFGLRSTQTGHGQALAQAGFTFSTDGLPANHQFIGRGVWSQDITFHNDDANDVVSALSAATSSAVWTMVSDAAVQLGTITFAAGGSVGTVAWATDPYIHPAGAGLTLYAPSPADATLGRVNGRVVGYLSS